MHKNSFWIIFQNLTGRLLPKHDGGCESFSKNLFCQMPVALRRALILFPDCNIAAPVSFFSGEAPLTYTHHNPWRTYIRRNPSPISAW